MAEEHIARQPFGLKQLPCGVALYATWIALQAALVMGRGGDASFLFCGGSSYEWFSMSVCSIWARISAFHHKEGLP